jgi:hypothetical protein
MAHELEAHPTFSFLRDFDPDPFDGYYEPDFYYDEPYREPPPGDESWGFSDKNFADHEDDPHEEVIVPDEIVDQYLPAHSSRSKLSAGRSRAKRYFLKNGKELPGKLAFAEQRKRTRKPHKFGEGCWKNRKRKQWQNDNYPRIGPVSIKQLPVVETPSVEEVTDFGIVELELDHEELELVSYI